MKWDRLDNTKKYGGWGMKNIDHFGKALAAKSLQRCVFSISQWCDIIKDKYIRQRNVVDWIRGVKQDTKGISNIWRCPLNSYHILNDWLA